MIPYEVGSKVKVSCLDGLADRNVEVGLEPDAFRPCVGSGVIRSYEEGVYHVRIQEYGQVFPFLHSELQVLQQPFAPDLERRMSPDQQEKARRLEYYNPSLCTSLFEQALQDGDALLMRYAWERMMRLKTQGLDLEVVVSSNGAYEGPHSERVYSRRYTFSHTKRGMLVYDFDASGLTSHQTAESMGHVMNVLRSIGEKCNCEVLIIPRNEIDETATPRLHVFALHGVARDWNP